MGEQFQNYIESIINTRLDQELDNKVKQYCQETIEQNLNTKIDQIFQAKTETFEKKIKEKLKNEKKEFSKQSNVEFEQNCLLFEQSLTLKLEEMIETKSQELSVKFEAQIIKELGQAMSVVQQVLNNGLDLDRNIEKELNTKFQEYLQGHRQELDEVLEKEVNKKIQDSLTTKDQFMNNILEKKVDVCLKNILQMRYQQINVKLEKQVNKTLKEVLDNKTQLLKLTSDDSMFENTENEHVNKNNAEMQNIFNNKEYEKRFENLNYKIKALEEELRQKKDDHKKIKNNFDGLHKKIIELEGKLNSVDKLNNSRGKYINWEPRHDLLKQQSLVSTVDFINTLNTIKNLDGNSSIQNAAMIKIFNSMKIHRINPTTRFPIKDTFIDLNHCEIANKIRLFYGSLKSLTMNYYSCNPLPVIKAMQIGIEIAECDQERVEWVLEGQSSKGFITVRGFPKFDVIKFEEVNGLVWSES